MSKFCFCKTTPAPKTAEKQKQANGEKLSPTDFIDQLDWDPPFVSVEKEPLVLITLYFVFGLVVV